MPFLENSFHCLDCDWVGERRESCEKCGSLTVHPVSSWLNPSEQLRRVMEAPVNTETRLRELTHMFDGQAFSILKHPEETDEEFKQRVRVHHHSTSPADPEAGKSRTV
jgi:hypothetical protein